jgi:predicted oxidoreductase
VRGSRERVVIATKVGICKGGRYDLSAKHIREGIEGSLRRMGIDYVDLYQLHRPDPLADPRETAEAIDDLVARRLVRAVGVSNYYPHQLAALRRYLKAPVVSNQISISLLRLDPVYEGAAGGGGDGVLDQCEELSITPLAYSPLGGGWLSGRREVPADHPQRATIERTVTALQEVGKNYGDATAGQVALAWLLRHPAGIVPLVGSNDPAHIREALEATKINLSREEWYKLWTAARGAGVP